MSARAGGSDSAMASGMPDAETATSGPAPDAPMASSALPMPPPKVTNVVPAMFVPLDSDLTQPFDPPRDRVERARSMIESIDFYRTGVRRGMLHLVDMDRRRILAEAAWAEAQAQAQARAKPGEDGSLSANEALDPAEADAMIASMQAPANPEVDYNISNDYLARQPPRFDKPAPNPRRDTVRQLQQVVERAVSQMGGYDAHIGGIRSRWQAALDKEQRLLDARFGELLATTSSGSSTTTGILGSTGNTPNASSEGGATAATVTSGAMSAAPPTSAANTTSGDVVMGGT